MNYRMAWVALVVAGSLVVRPSSLWAFAHLWDIKEIFTNHDGSVQFIEMKTPNAGAPSEQFVQNATIRAVSTVGGVEQPAVVFTFPANIPVTAGQNTNNRHLLIATASIATHLPEVPRDFTLPANFFAPNADSVTFTFSAGPDIVTLGSNLIFTDGVTSVTDMNLFGVANFQPGVNSPTNFAGATGSVNIPPPPEGNGDYNGDGQVDAGDYVRWRNHLGDADETNLNFQGDGGDVALSDYLYWKERYGDVIEEEGGGGIASPESSSLAAVLGGLVCLAARAARRRRWDCPAS